MKGILTLLIAAFILQLTDLNGTELPKSLPDVRSWRTATYDESFFQGRTVCGEEALTFMWQSFNGTVAETTRDADGNWIIHTK